MQVQRTSYTNPQNIEFTDRSQIASAVNLLWQNDGLVSDLSFAEVPAPTVQLPPDMQAACVASWANLEHRAQAYLEKHTDGPDAFYSGPVLRFESFSPAGVSVSRQLAYKTVTGIRSDAQLFEDVAQAGLLQTAFVVKSIFITADDKLVLGKRNFYGDWPLHRFECPGGFLGVSDIEIGSVATCAIDKISGDYDRSGALTAQPFLLYSVPRILETIMLCVARTSATAAELQSDFYSELLVCDNTTSALDALLQRPLDQFHPPSRVALELYRQYGEIAQ